jgi:hypothetical protein
MVTSYCGPAAGDGQTSSNRVAALSGQSMRMQMLCPYAFAYAYTCGFDPDAVLDESYIAPACTQCKLFIKSFLPV